MIEIRLANVGFVLQGLKDTSGNQEFLMQFQDNQSGIAVSCSFSLDALAELREQLNTLDLGQIRPVASLPDRVLKRRN